MVPVKVNFYQYRDEVKKALLREKARVDTDWDPFVAAWLAYALSRDGLKDNLVLSDLIGALHRWSQEQEVWESQRHLGPLSLLLYLYPTERRTTMEETIERLLKQLGATDIESRLSPFRDPEQVFLITLSVASAKERGKGVAESLARVIREQMKGPLKRRLLYAAALNELGETVEPPVLAAGADPGDVIASVWWSERYGQGPERTRYWPTFGNIKETLALGEGDRDVDSHQRVLSVSELAMLYEALTRETVDPEPSMLFDMYPLHPRVKEIAGSLFRNGEYLNAVFEAVKALNDFIRTRTGLSSGETALIETALGNPSAREIKNPRLKFNALDPGSLDYRSQQNEQRGLSYLAHGVIFAFRHPKGHEPKDKDWVTISAYEALDQLVTVSYLMRRVEEAS